MLTLKQAQELNATMVADEALLLHELNVCYAMGAMARHFGKTRNTGRQSAPCMITTTKNIRTNTFSIRRSHSAKPVSLRKISAPY